MIQVTPESKPLSEGETEVIKTQGILMEGLSSGIIACICPLTVLPSDRACHVGPA